MKNKKIIFILVICLVLPLVFMFNGCSSKDPSKLIFKNSPYVENSPYETSDWESFEFGIKKDGSYYFEFTKHKYSINNRLFTDVNFDRVEGTWELIGKYDQEYKVYKTSAKLTSVSKKQSLAIYKLNGLVGGFYADIAEDGTITKNVDSYQGYCVYKYGDNTSWSVGKTEYICIFFTNEIIDETLLDRTVRSDGLSTGWRYDSIGECNYSHTVKI